MFRSRGLLFPAAAIASLMVGCGYQPPSNNTGSAAGKLSGTMIPAAGVGQEDGQWLMAAKDDANTRFSGLNQINTGNAGSLKVAWTFSAGLLNGHEGAPLVVGTTMYLVTPFRRTRRCLLRSREPRSGFL